MPIPKPDSCKGCPFYDKSNYITPDLYIKNSPILILAQNPGEGEENGIKVEGTSFNNYNMPITTKVKPQPLIGKSGKWLKDAFWPLTKLSWDSVSKANVIKCRPYNQNELPSFTSKKPYKDITIPMLRDAITHCTTNYLRIPPATKYIMALGSLSLYHLTGEASITDWRGWVLGKNTSSHIVEGITNYYHPLPQDIKIFPTLHVASLFRNKDLHHATLADFSKFGALVRDAWPKPLPEITINKLPQTLPNVFGFDTEYDPEDNNRLIMYSLATRDRYIYVVDAEIASLTKKLVVPPNTNVVTQNGLVDIGHLASVFDVNSIILQDCMLAHAVLWPGERHNLDYMTSIYGMFNRHKHLRTTHDKATAYLYAGLDADTTLNHVWMSMIKEFKTDALSWNEYSERRRPLLSPIFKSQLKGVLVDKDRVSILKRVLDKELSDIIEEAKVVTANPDFNILSTQQVSKAIYKGNFNLKDTPKAKVTSLVASKAKRKKKGELTLDEVKANQLTLNFNTLLTKIMAEVREIKTKH